MTFAICLIKKTNGYEFMNFLKGSFSKHQTFGIGFNTHNFLLSILVEHGLVGIFFVSLFALILILKMKSWIQELCVNNISINIDI